MSQTPSQQNAYACRQFIPTLHTTPYPAIDPSLTKHPSPYIVYIIGGHGAAGGELARSYARAGAVGIILTTRNLQSLETTAQEARTINRKATVLVTEYDITFNSSVEALARTTQATFNSHLNTVIVNSGIPGPIHRYYP
ncbi:hypothetical protein ETB97_003790 [Aspergillus alliaceus]|uniref:Uncharacterized protein n=1 Tax=Petromyces alliaceus TaxID=209559 RepID=A0A8H5ZZN2_PETAA|nr:hypothetical protein ETB97_003790 [Aspergillus burnettii]